VARENGAAPVERCVDLLAGDLSLIVGTPETDPLPASARVTYIGPILWRSADEALPEWLCSLGTDRPVIWVYSGNPRYFRVPTRLDSVVVIRATVAALALAPVNVVLTTGYQALPLEFSALPPNFYHAAYLPGLAMAQRSDLMIHHGGHSSVMTELFVGTPAVIIPTTRERESNARRVASLGAGEVLVPGESDDGEKQLDAALLARTVRRVLDDPSYRRAAHRIASSMREYGGVQAAADHITHFAGTGPRVRG